MSNNKKAAYPNQVLPEVLNKECTEFANYADALNKLKKAKIDKTTVYAYCFSGDPKTGRLELSFYEDMDNALLGYVTLQEVTYNEKENKVHVGRSIDSIDQYIGVKILEIEEQADGRVDVKCSRKDAAKEIHDMYNRDIDNGVFTAGQTVTGVVTGMDFGKVYVDIGGDVTAILGVADISRVYVKEPSDVIKVGQVLELGIKKLYSNPIKVSLSRAMLQSGWETIDKRFKVGRIVPGKVKNFISTGVFIELNECFEGLAEDLPSGQKYNYGDKVKVLILNIDKKREKIKLKVIENR